MENNLHTEKDVLGVLYIVQELRNRYQPEFAVSSKNAYQKFEDFTEQSFQKVSESTFMRMFNFYKKPKISYTSMNKITQWFTKGDYYVFTKYTEAHLEKIKDLELISKEELMEIVMKIEDENEVIKVNSKGKEKKEVTAAVYDNEEEYTEENPHKKRVVSKNDNGNKTSIVIKQKNKMSAFNYSKINKIKGKISQLNFLSFGNKQVVEGNND
jgi:hypothetical protein